VSIKGDIYSSDTSSTGLESVTAKDRYSQSGFVFSSPSLLYSDDMIKWCSQHFGSCGLASNWMWTTGSDYISNNSEIVIYFKNQENWMLFTLTWA
jgi:hypothetical protein